MVLVARAKAAWSRSLLGASRVTAPKEKQPEVPQVMLAGLGNGLAAAASACPVNRAGRGGEGGQDRVTHGGGVKESRVGSGEVRAVGGQKRQEEQTII